jgi:L-fuculose-phosphate aldolase
VTASKTLQLRPIGYVEHSADESTPLDEWASVEARIVVDPALVAGLDGLEPGREILIVFWFDRSEGFDLLQHPKGDTSRPQRGVFSLRSPHRPNPIGVSEVQLIAVEGNVLRVRGLDAFDTTPVLDIKPVRKP